MRTYIGDKINIDGRMIGYRIYTADSYLKEKGYSEKEIKDFQETNYEIHERITQIIALKQSCWLLRRTSYSCGSLSEGLYNLKNELIFELKSKYNYDFDDKLMEKFCGNL